MSDISDDNSVVIADAIITVGVIYFVVGVIYYRRYLQFTFYYRRYLQNDIYNLHL